MRRREFINLLGGAMMLPLGAEAQERIRRIGVLMPYAKDDKEAQARVAAFIDELQQLGWINGRNVKIEYRFDTGDLKKAAAELLTSSPEVILASATPAVAALQQATRIVPIVFAQVSDPVSAGFVASLAKPGGNITGFMNFDYTTAAKWLELLKEIAPNVTRVGVIRDPTSTVSIGQLAAINSVARTFGVEVTPLGGVAAGDIERTVTEFARGPNGGLIVVATASLADNRGLIISLAAKHRLRQQFTRFPSSSLMVA